MTTKFSDWLKTTLTDVGTISSGDRIAVVKETSPGVWEPFYAVRIVQADSSNVVLGTIAVRKLTEAAGSLVVFANGEICLYSDTQRARVGTGVAAGGEDLGKYIFNEPITIFNQLGSPDANDTIIALSNIQAGNFLYPNAAGGAAPGLFWDHLSGALFVTGINNDGTKSTDPTRLDVAGTFRSNGNGHIFERVTTNTTLSDFPKSLIVDTSGGNRTINLDPEGTLGLVNELWPEGTTITILKDGINNNANSVTIDSIGTTWGAALFYSNATPAGAATYSFTGRWAGVRVTRLPAAVVSEGWFVEPF